MIRRGHPAPVAACIRLPTVCCLKGAPVGRIRSGYLDIETRCIYNSKRCLTMAQ